MPHLPTARLGPCRAQEPAAAADAKAAVLLDRVAGIHHVTDHLGRTLRVWNWGSGLYTLKSYILEDHLGMTRTALETVSRPRTVLRLWDISTRCTRVGPRAPES